MIVILRKNRSAAYGNKKFVDIIKDSNSTDTDDISLLRKKFAASKLAKAIWNCNIRCFISKSLRSELKLLSDIMKNKKFCWETPIAHLIPRTPDFSAWGDSSIEAAGGFSLNLKFFWHVKWPKEITSKTLKYFTIRTKENEQIISINLLEYAVVIVNYAIATKIISDQKLCSKFKYQSLLNWSDNKTAISWTKKAAISTDKGKALFRIFCSICVNNNVNCISDYINTKENILADKISRSNYLFSTDLKILLQEHPELKSCRRFQLNPEFLSCITRALLLGQSPPIGHCQTRVTGCCTSGAG